MADNSMKIGILQCDSVREAFQPKFGDYPQMIQTLFAGVEPNLTFNVYRIRASEYPENIDECDAYVTTGSRDSVYDDLPWIPLLEMFIRDLDREKKPFLGICFGHQLMVKALGGNVRKSDKGWGIGVTENHITSRKSWMNTDQSTLRLIASHQDQVVTLPASVDIEVLAGSLFCPYYMLALGEHFLSVQGHPEFSKEYSAALIDYRRNIIPAKQIEQGKASLKEKTDDQLFARWVLQFMNIKSL